MAAAVDYLKVAKDIVLVATGTCMSAAVTILACGGQRFCTLNTRFMVHLPFQVSQERQDTHALVVDKQELELSEKLIVRTLAAKTKKRTQWWLKKLRSGFYFDSVVAKQIGLVDGVL